MSLPLPDDLIVYLGRRDKNFIDDETRHRLRTTSRKAKQLIEPVLQPSLSARDAWFALIRRFQAETDRIFSILIVATVSTRVANDDDMTLSNRTNELDHRLKKITNSLNLANEFHSTFHDYLFERFWSMLCDEVWNDAEREYFVMFFNVLNQPVYHASKYALPVLNKVMKQQFLFADAIDSDFVIFLLEKGALIDANRVALKLFRFYNDPRISASIEPSENPIKKYFSERYSNQVSYPRRLSITWNSIDDE